MMIQWSIKHAKAAQETIARPTRPMKLSTISKSFYFSKCCDPSTCRLKSFASCDDSLRCCRDCQIEQAGVQCREVVNECDFPEYCSGVSSEVS